MSQSLCVNTKFRRGHFGRGLCIRDARTVMLVVVISSCHPPKNELFLDSPIVCRKFVTDKSEKRKRNEVMAATADTFRRTLLRVKYFKKWCLRWGFRRQVLQSERNVLVVSCDSHRVFLTDHLSVSPSLSSFLFSLLFFIVL